MSVRIGRMTMFAKPVKWRSKKYLQWVKSLPCCICESTADDAHHIQARGLGKGMGTKISDVFSIPLCREHHSYAHGVVGFQDECQMIAALRTIEKALNEGVLS